MIDFCRIFLWYLEIESYLALFSFRPSGNIVGPFAYLEVYNINSFCSLRNCSSLFIFSRIYVMLLATIIFYISSFFFWLHAGDTDSLLESFLRGRLFLVRLPASAISFNLEMLPSHVSISLTLLHFLYRIVCDPVIKWITLPVRSPGPSFQ